jgi:hypothetical protein
MLFRTGATVTLIEADWLDREAEMAAVPVPTAVTNPADTLATVLLEDDQLAEAVTSFVEPSLYLAEAVNCWVELVANERGAEGVRDNDTTVTGGCV